MRGRAITARASTIPAEMRPKVTSSSVEMARRLPNSTFVTVLALRVARELNSTPSPVAKARIVPVETSRSASRLPSRPMASAPPRVNTARPRVTGTPMQDGARGAREADVGQGVGGEGVLAHDDEVAEQAGGDRDDRAADEGVAHEVGLEHVPPVGLERDRAEDVHGALRVNRSPVAVRTTLTCVP